MHRDTKEVFGATSGTDQVNVVPAQQIMADQSIRIRQHLEEVVWPVLKKWRIFERDDFTARGEAKREELAAFLEDLERQAVKFEEMRDRSLAREAAKAERLAS